MPISKMKNSPLSVVGSRWSGSMLRSRTVKRQSSGRRANRRATLPCSSASAESIFASLPASCPRVKYTSPVEHGNDFLVQASLYFAAAVAAVMISHRLGLGSVAGYLLAGIAIGPWGFQLVETVDHIKAFAALGVVFLLFVICLELEPKRLWSMRAQLLGLGLAQVLGSIVAITLAGLALGFDWRVSLIAGMALSLSSTALALAPLTERGALATKGGQGTFAVLLFQDIAVIPMLAVLPLLGSAAGGTQLSWQKIGLALAVIVVTLGGG